MGAEIDSLEVKITSEAGTAEKAIDSLVKSLGKLAASLKFDTSSLEKLGNINGNNFKKLGEGLQSFSGAAKNLQNVNSRNFNKLANGIERIASIDSSKLEALGKIDGNSFRGLGEGVKALSSGLQNLQGVKKADFNRLATGIERLAAIQPGNMEAVGNVLRPLAEGINILSNAKFDNKNLTNLINSLTRLSNANTGSLANIDFSTLGNSIKGLADTLSGAEKVQQNTISMTNAIAKLANSGENANIVSAALPQLGEKLKSFMQTMAGATQLESDTIAFTQALAQLANAGKRAESTASGLPKLGESLKNIFDIMSKMPSINENTIRMTQALAQLANAGGKAGNAAGNLNGRINTLSSSMLGLRGTTLKAVGGLKNFARQLLSSMGVYLGIYGAIRGAKKAIDISSDLTEVQNVVDVTFGDMAYKVEEFSQTSIEQFGMSELALKQYSSRFQAMGSAMGIDSSLIGNANENLARMTDGYISASDSMADMSLNLTKLTADMASFYNVEQDIVAEKLASIFTGQTRPLRDFGLDLTQATLQEWALKQGMDVNIQSMSQAEKTMLRYQYVLANTTAAQGDFARTALTWANQVRILKQNFEQLASVIGGALVNAFKPVVIAINKAMSAFIAFAKTISNSLGQIFGWTFEEGGGGLAQDFGGAADAADDMAGSLGDAEKSIDKIKAGLRAFDELKVINLPDDKDGGAGAGGAGGLGGAGGALGGQWIQGESILKKYESELDTLYKLGDYIGKKLTEAMDSIDWDSVYEKARNFGKGLADFLNGLISPDLFGALGRTIAGALNTALYAALSFGETFDWKDFGLSIATGINNFFATYDFAGLAKTLNVWAKGILDTAITAIDNTDWEEIGRQIGVFLEGIDFIEIGKKIGKLIWKAINAGVKVLSGMFDAAPIETTIIAAVALPKLLKTITASRYIVGVKNLGKSFEKAFSIAKKSFEKFRFGIENGNFAVGINEGIKSIRDNLTKLQKGAIVAIAGFAEFSVVSNSFERLALGTENWLAEIGKIAGVAAAAAAAMYVALGPAGLAIAGITGVVAAIKGINDAFDTIRAQEIGESIKNAMSNPGGVPLSEVTAQFSDAIGKIGESFTVVTEKAAGLEQADNHIRDTWMEIEKIETAMDTGVMSVEEGTAELTRLFGELATTASEKFSALEYTLLAAFGENGVLTGVYERLGISTENTTATIIQLNDKVEQRIEELTGLLAQTDPSNPNYAKYKEELAGLMSQTDELTQAISEYDFALKNIDYSELILPDGTLDTTALQNFLEELKAATETANSDIENAINTTRQSLEQEKSLAESLGDWVAAEEIQAKLDVLPQAMDVLKGDISLKAAELTDTIQIDFINGMNGVIEDAQTEWGEKGFWGQIWNGVFGAGTEGEFVKKAVDQQVENIGQLSSAIETELRSLKVDGVAWGSEAIEEIYGSLFDTEYHFSDMGGKTVYSLNENFKSLINGATEGISELAAERGQDTVEGYNIGIEDNVNTSEEKVKTWMERIHDSIHDSIMEFGSPSKATEQFGQDTVEGYNNGIEYNAESTMSTISKYTTSIFDKFSEIIDPLNQIGIDAMQGLMNGLSSMESSIYEKADEIARNVANTVKKALDIHSPSRVMFALGDYTMQGFKEGMENLYNPITASIKTFSYDVALAPAPSFSDMYGGYVNPTVEYTPQYGGNSGITGMTETGLYNLIYNATASAINNSKLMNDQKDMVEGILKKPTMEIGDLNTALARDSMYKGGNIRGGNMSRLAVAEEVYY